MASNAFDDGNIRERWDVRLLHTCGDALLPSNVFIHHQSFMQMVDRGRLNPGSMRVPRPAYLGICLLSFKSEQRVLVGFPFSGLSQMGVGTPTFSDIA